MRPVGVDALPKGSAGVKYEYIALRKKPVNFSEKEQVAPHADAQRISEGGRSRDRGDRPSGFFGRQFGLRLSS